MRRFSFILCLTLLGLLLVACVQPIQSPIGKNPTKPFILTDQYLTDGAFFQQKKIWSSAVLPKKSRDCCYSLWRNNRFIDQNYTYVMESGLWKSNLSHQVPVIKSIIWLSKIPLIKTIKDIHFGDIWLLAGEGFVNIPLSEIRGPILEPTASLGNGFYNKVLTKVPGLILPDRILQTRSAVLPITLLGDWPKNWKSLLRLF